MKRIPGSTNRRSSAGTFHPYIRAVLSTVFFLFIGTVTGSCLSHPPEKELLERTGSFESTRGVRKRVSCFCFNSGYLTTPEKERIPVCFRDESFQVKCSHIRARGQFVTVRTEQSPAGSCRAGDLSIFFPEQVDCISAED